MDIWKTLNREGKDSLFVLLYTGKLLWKRVAFFPGRNSEDSPSLNCEMGQWRFFPYQPGAEDFHTSLVTYGECSIVIAIEDSSLDMSCHVVRSTS